MAQRALKHLSWLVNDFVLTKCPRCLVDSYEGFGGISEMFRRDILPLYSTLKMEAICTPERVLSPTIYSMQYHMKP